MTERVSPISKPQLAFLGLMISSLLVAAMMAWLSDSRDQPSSADADTFSASALGHGALVDALKMTKLEVLISRWDTERLAANTGLLIILEPNANRVKAEQRDRYRAMLASAPRSLVVVPRRAPAFGSSRQRWVNAVKDVDAQVLRATLSPLGLNDAQLVVAAPEAVRWQAAPSLNLKSIKPNLIQPRLLKDVRGIEPLIWCEQGVLFGRISLPSTKRPVYVLSDPDLLANHGLHKDQNLEIALAAVDVARQEHNVILIDEITHGLEMPPSLGRLLLSFPLALITIQVGLLLFLVLWASIGRFGAPRRAFAKGEAAFAEQFYIENTAELLLAGGHAAHMLERYVWMILEDAARKLNAPTDLDRPELMLWLHHLSEAKQLQLIHLPTLISRLERWSTGKAKAKPQQLLSAAKDISRWRGAILDGSATATKP